MTVISAPLPPVLQRDRVLAVWFAITAGLILLIVVIGGITRLTESGLSITEWKPVSGILPPLTEQDWIQSFEHYKTIPEYQEIHSGMTLAEYQQIFFWEYLHRLWGRMIGLVAFIPLVIYGLRPRHRRRPGLWLRLLAVPVLVGLQGALGWYMVKSGLVGRTSVSQYRLTAHLALAVSIYGYLVWNAAELWGRRLPKLAPALAKRGRVMARLVLGLVALTMLAGGFTAGLKAGLTYNTFPLMDGQWIPAGYFFLDPWWLNPFENIAAVQFDHRCLAMASFAVILVFRVMSQGLPAGLRRPVTALLLMACAQVALGISTLLWVVPIPLAAAHQTGAVLLLTLALITLHGFCRASAPDARH